MRIVITLTVLFALAGCNSDKTTTITSSDGKEVKITTDGGNTADSGTVTFEGKDGKGKVTFGDAAVKAGLPLGLPLYPGGEVSGAFTGTGGAGDLGGMATVVTSDSADKVIGFYKAEAEKRGFSVKSQSTSQTGKGSISTFTAKGKDEASMVVTVTPEESGKSTVVIIASQKG